MCIRDRLIGTVTDIDGKYSITANVNDVLVITYVGMESQEVAIGGKAIIDIILDSDVRVLSEVIVTALGIKEDRKKLSYSAQSIGGRELQETQRDNAVMGLQGRVAGLSLTPTSGIPGSSVNITLRGVNSIGNSNQPLFVVDGLPINSGTFDTVSYTHLDVYKRQYIRCAFMHICPMTVSVSTVGIIVWI